MEITKSFINMIKGKDYRVRRVKSKHVSLGFYDLDENSSELMLQAAPKETRSFRKVNVRLNLPNYVSTQSLTFKLCNN